MTGQSWHQILGATRKVFWVAFLVCLPVLSFPHFPESFGGGTLVRPLAVYPLIVLLVIATIPYLFKKRLPPTILSLLPFLIIAVASSIFSTLQGTEMILGISLLDRTARALVTLVIGAAIYLTVALLPQSVDDLRYSLRWLYAGFGLALLWGSLQAVYVIHYSHPYFKFINDLQKSISIRRLFTTRISGTAYEPNWFAVQIAFLLIPWLLASVLTNYSVFRWRWRRVTVEALVLAWAVSVLIFTFSRAGLLILLALFIASLLFLRRPKHHSEIKGRRSKRWRHLIEALLIIAILTGVVYAAGANNVFFARIWDYWYTEKNKSLANYLEYLGFGARFIYGETALRVYQAYPVLGVGLGNYAFHFDEMLPDTPLPPMPEVLRLVTPEPGNNRLITPKNLYFRLLAETGLLGTAAFMAFVVALLGCALYLRLSSNQQERYWGTAGILGLVAFILAAFSYDSFALPNMWVVFGLITAATWAYHRQNTVSPPASA